MKVVQIGSLFYCAIVDGDKIEVCSEGYPTYELCYNMTKMHEMS